MPRLGRQGRGRVHAGAGELVEIIAPVTNQDWSEVLSEQPRRTTTQSQKCKPVVGRANDRSLVAQLVQSIRVNGVPRPLIGVDGKKTYMRYVKEIRGRCPDVAAVL